MFFHLPMGRILPSSVVQRFSRCLGLPLFCPCVVLPSCRCCFLGLRPLPGTNSMPRCSTFTCRVTVNLRPFSNSISLPLSGAPVSSRAFSVSESTVLPMVSRMRTRLAAISISSWVWRSILTNEGLSSPVSVFARSTIRLRLPVSFRLRLSSSVKRCPLYSRSRLGAVCTRCGTRRTVPSSCTLKARRAAVSKVCPSNFGETLTKSDLP